MDETQMAEALFAAFESHVAKAVAPLLARIKQLEDRPAPELLRGEPGQDADMQAVAERVDAFLSGVRIPEDGASVTTADVEPILRAMADSWALDFERRAQGVLERAAARIPVPKDGRDALDLEDFELELADDDRTVTMRLRRGDTVVERQVRFPTVLHQGVYSEKASYSRNDAVTYGGSLWISSKDAPEGAPGVSADWRLSVKRGRDGKESVSIPRDPAQPVRIGG